MAVHLDINNIEESIKLYAITLQADISLDRKASKTYFKNFQSQKFVDPSSRKEMILRKLDEIERKQDEILQVLPKFDPLNIENLINEFERKSASTNEELEDVLSEMHNNYIKKKTKLTLDNAIEYYTKINHREKDLDELTKDLNNYKINFRVNKKIDELYKILENALDDVLKNQTFSIENFTKVKKDKNSNFSINKGNNSNILNESFLSMEMINSMKNNIRNQSKDRDLNNSLITKNYNNNIMNKGSEKNILRDSKDENKNISYLKNNKLNNLNLKNKNIANMNNKINIEAIDKINQEMVEKRSKE